MEELTKKIAEVIEELHQQFGWFNEEELTETPRRINRFYTDWADVSTKDFKFTTFPVKGKAALITIKNMEFASICAHHLLPFTGKVSVAYLPYDDGVYAGLSKFARAVDKVSHKPQTQEIMTEELTEYLWRNLNKPKFLLVMVYDAVHTCTTIRGPEQNHPEMGTDGMRWSGITESIVKSLREEAMNILLKP